MLRNREHGFAVMNKELTALSLEDINLETCKRYCFKGSLKNIINKAYLHKTGEVVYRSEK